MCRRVHFPIYELGPVVHAAELLKSGMKLVPVCGRSPCFTPFTAHRSKSSNVLLPSSSGGGGRPQAEILLMDVKKLWRLIDPSLPPLKTVLQMDRHLIGCHANLPIIAANDQLPRER